MVVVLSADDRSVLTAGIVVIVSILLFIPPALTTASAQNPVAPPSFFTPVLLDMNGQLTHYSKVGQQSIIRVTIPSSFNSGQSFVGVVEVRDYSGISIFLTWANVVSSSDTVYHFETTWVPTEPCSTVVNGTACNANYQIRSFLISEFEQPQVLEAIRTLDDITIVPERLQEDNKTYDHYKVSLPDGEMDIEYHIDTGQISKVIAAPKFSGIDIALKGVSSDGSLTITLPHDLLNLMYNTFTYHYGNANANEISIAHQGQLPKVAVDDRFVEPDSILANEKGITWIIPVSKGSKVIEFENGTLR
jgi:hypothetical protein